MSLTRREIIAAAAGLAAGAGAGAGTAPAAPLRWKHPSSRTGDLPTPPGSTQQTLCVAGDLDKDGRTDFLIGCRGKAPALVWFRRTGGTWKAQIVEAESLPIEAGGVLFDVDGDGWPDLIAGNDYQGPGLFWWRNPGPPWSPDNPWTRYAIKTTGAHQHHDQIVGDFDRDGRPELVFWNQGAQRLFSAPIPADPAKGPWRYEAIWEGPGEGAAAGDIDGDGKPELLAGGKWFEYRGGGRFEAHVIDPAQTHPRMAVGDLNGDGRLEVVMVPGDTVGRLKWYTCSGDARRTESWTGHDLVGHDIIHGHTLAVADLRRSGHLDVVCGEMAKWTESAPQPDNPTAHLWAFLGDGRGGFALTEVASGIGVHEARVADLDGDGRPDILGKPYCWDTPRLDMWVQEA